jgi:tetratricopeptide (TPR) repeat protein
MATTRLETLKSMLARNPLDSFARYGLALEYRTAGDLDSAIAEFEALMSAAPDYVPAYYQAGQTLELRGRPEEAREVYRRGLEAAARKGDAHARGEIEAALDLLG